MEQHGFFWNNSLQFALLYFVVWFLWLRMLHCSFCAQNLLFFCGRFLSRRNYRTNTTSFHRMRAEERNEREREKNTVWLWLHCLAAQKVNDNVYQLMHNGENWEKCQTKCDASRNACNEKELADVLVSQLNLCWPCAISVAIHPTHPAILGNVSLSSLIMNNNKLRIDCQVKR